MVRPETRHAASVTDLRSVVQMVVGGVHPFWEGVRCARGLYGGRAVVEVGRNVRPMRIPMVPESSSAGFR